MSGIHVDSTHSSSQPVGGTSSQPRPDESLASNDASERIVGTNTDQIKIVFDADYQHNLVSRVSPIQSSTFDNRFQDVAVRPVALNLATPLLQRHVDEKISQGYSDHMRFNLGDIVDSSNLAEWVLYLLAHQDGHGLEEVLPLPENSQDWNEEEWRTYLNQLDTNTWETYLDALAQYMKTPEGERLLMGVEGNHDGAAWGNGLEHPIPLPVLEFLVLVNTKKKHDIEIQIAALKRKLSHGANPRVHDRLEKKILELQRELDTINQKLAALEKYHIEETSTPDPIMDEAALREAEILEKRIEELRLKMEQRHLSPMRQQRLEEKLKRLQRRYEMIAHRLHYYKEERDKGRERLNESTLDRGFEWRIPRFIVNRFLGVQSLRGLNDPSGNWAANSGGAQYNFDKEDYLYQYLSGRYPNLSITRSDNDHDTVPSPDKREHHNLEPLVTKLFFNTLDNSDETTDYTVENSIYDAASGEYKKERSVACYLDSKNKNYIAENFANFWKQPDPVNHPEEWLCLVDYPSRDSASPSEHYLMIQVIDQGIVNGKHVYHFLLDGMDNTQEVMSLAYFASMSKLQRQLCQVFIDQKRLETQGECLFLHSSHFPLKQHSKSHWKKYGWQDYFNQSDVAPFVFCGHGHNRQIVDETKPHFFGKKVFFGTRSVKREEGFRSVMTPSVTDSPNEFMTATFDWTEDGSVRLDNEYHQVVDDVDVAAMDKEVIEKVRSIKETYRQHHYWGYSQVDTGLVSGLRNIFFSQERIVAYDSIPLSIGQYEETLLYTQCYLEFLRDDLGAEDPFVLLVEKTLADLERHRDLWLNGNPGASDEYDQMGYLAAVEKSKTFKRQSDRVNLLIKYDDIFAVPAYERLRLLITQTPSGTKAFDFWLLLGKEAATEEKLPTNKREAKQRTKGAVPTSNSFSFLPASAKTDYTTTPGAPGLE